MGRKGLGMGELFSLRIRKDKVLTVIKNAGYLGIFVSILSPVLYIIVTPESAVTSDGLVFSILLGIIFLVASIATLLKSRVGAVSLTILYFLDMLSIFIFGAIYLEHSQALIGVAVHLIFFMVFLRATKATFIYHKYMKS